MNGRHLFKEQLLALEKKSVTFKVVYKDYYKDTKNID